MLVASSLWGNILGVPQFFVLKACSVWDLAFGKQGVILLKGFFCRNCSPDTMLNREHLLTYIYLLVYILLSSGVILYNKVRHSVFSALFVLSCFCFKYWIMNITLLFVHLQWVLSTKYFNFPYPITLTMIHMGFSGVVAFFLIRVFKVRIGSCLNWRCLHFE